MRFGIALAFALALALTLEMGGNAPLAAEAAIVGHDVVLYPDGDGLVLRERATRRRFVTRFCGIDCPEHGQDGMARARDFVRRIVETRRLRLVKNGLDVHNRTLVSLVVAETGETLSTLLVRTGHCLVYPKYLRRCASESPAVLLAAQREAAADGRGITRRVVQSTPTMASLSRQEPLHVSLQERRPAQAMALPWAWRRAYERRHAGKAFITSINRG